MENAAKEIGIEVDITFDPSTWGTGMPHVPALELAFRTALPSLMVFSKNGRQSIVDIQDGKLVFSGDVTPSEAARELFEYLSDQIPGWMIRKFGAQAIREMLDKAAN